MANIWNFKSLIRNDLSSQTPTSPIDATSKALPNATTPPKKQNLNRATSDILSENREVIPKINSAKTLVKTKSKLNAITNNDELDKTKNDSELPSLSTISKKRPFVQSNESINPETKLDENKKILSEPELKFKKIKSSNKIISSCDVKTKNSENDKTDSKLINPKLKNDSENILSTINSIITPPPSHNTNGTSSCTNSVSSSCNYNTSPASLSSLCLNKEQNKLKTKSEFEDKMDKDELKKIRRRKNSASPDKDKDNYRKEKDRDRDKHRRSSNSHQVNRRNHKRRNSNDYENDSDADSYYSYKNGHSRHHSKETQVKVNRHCNLNGMAKNKPDDDETCSTVSTMSSSSSSSGEKNYKKYPESKYSQNKQHTNHNREEFKSDADYIKRMLKLYEKIAVVQSSKQFDLLAKICGLVKPFSFTENSLFNFDLFTLDINVVEKLESLILQSAQAHSIQNNSTSILDTSKKNKTNEFLKT